MRTEEFESAVGVFLQSPGIDYVRGLQLLLERDPAYLDVHRHDIMMIAEAFLNNAGFVRGKLALNQYALSLIGEALGRLRASEHGKSSA